MTAKLSDIALATRNNYAKGLRNPTPEFLAWWGSLNDKDITVQVVDYLDMPGEGDGSLSRQAHRVAGWLVGAASKLRATRAPRDFKDAAE